MWLCAGSNPVRVTTIVYMRDKHYGNASAFQAEERSSILRLRSTVGEGEIPPVVSHKRNGTQTDHRINTDIYPIAGTGVSLQNLRNAGSTPAVSSKLAFSSVGRATGS